MKKILSHRHQIAFAIFSLVFLFGCQKKVETTSAANEEIAAKAAPPKEFKNFVQVNLVGDNNEYNPVKIDPNLVNGWGLDFPASGNIRVAAEGTGKSNVYTLDGDIAATAIAIPCAGTGAAVSKPTGHVCNASQDFKLTNGNPAQSIYASEDGAITGWNNGSAAEKMVDKFPTASYFGVAIAADGGNNFLYAANFAQGRIDVYDKNWATVNKTFSDPALPAGYSPFNVKNIDGMLYVTYAKKNSSTGEEETGNGKGYLNVFNTNGVLIKRFASQGKLNAPWGIAKAPAAFWGSSSQLSNMILVANFGDGHINIFDENGNFVDQLSSHGKVIEIDGLWGIAFPPPFSLRSDCLYFAAGPGNETHGLFGYIKNAFLN